MSISPCEQYDVRHRIFYPCGCVRNNVKGNFKIFCRHDVILDEFALPDSYFTGNQSSHLRRIVQGSSIKWQILKIIAMITSKLGETEEAEVMLKNAFNQTPGI
mmetsp:Transcript_121227/g.338356  ORF Transcript_121227/g.338356 Transcript_121227/m.338356 type:complete len:103 (+) Transcript_121227:752-1060(+)